MAKTCSRCREEKDLEEFYTSNGKNNPDGRQYVCKPCTNEDRVDRTRLRLYGITRKQYLEKLKEQGGVCKVCFGTNKSGRALFVDHNHRNGQIRGLLCSNCNAGLGHFLDDPELIDAGAAYLRSYNA